MKCPGTHWLDFVESSDSSLTRVFGRDTRTFFVSAFCGQDSLQHEMVIFSNASVRNLSRPPDFTGPFRHVFRVLDETWR